MRKKKRNSPDLQVWGNRVLLRAVGTEVVQEKVGSLYLPQSSAEDRQRHGRWEVVAVGPDVRDIEIQPGAEVIARKWATEEFERDNVFYRVADASQVIAVLLNY